VLRLLLVDDDVEFVSRIERYLSKDFEVVKAYSAPEAEMVFRPGRFDVVLLDIRLNETLKDRNC